MGWFDDISNRSSEGPGGWTGHAQDPGYYGLASVSNQNDAVIKNYEDNYHSDDKESVLADLRAGIWRGDPSQNPLHQPTSGYGGGPESRGFSVGSAQGGGRGSGNGQQDWQAFIASKGPIGYQDFRTNLPQLVNEFNNQYGYNWKATGRPGDYDTIDTGGGNIVDVHSSSGQMIWNPEGAGGGGSALDPFGGSYSSQQFTPPPAFVAPKAGDVFNDPGFQFRMSEGIKALERSKAAAGTLRTGGTAKDLTSFAQGLASQEYGQAYDRAQQDYSNKYNRAFNEYSTNYNHALGENQLANQYSLGDFNLGRDIFYQNQDRPFNKLYSMAQLGAQNSQTPDYSGQYANILQGGTQQGNEYGMQGANAGAAGKVAGNNAMQGAIGSISQMGNDLASYYATRPKSTTGGMSPYGPYAGGYQY